MNPKIMIVGGDYTSDRFGSALAQALLEKCPLASLFGIGGPLMNAAGVELSYDISEMVSLGVFQSIKGAHIVKRLIKRVAEAIDQKQPDLVLQIGLPVFGLRLLEIVQTKDIPVLYYYTPFSRGFLNVKPGDFAKVVTKVAGISRFETDLCQEAGIEAEFVGHPLLDLVQVPARKNRRKTKGGSRNSSIIGILPGSREVEVKNVLPTVLKSLEQLRKKDPNIETVIFMPPSIDGDFAEKTLKQGLDHGFRLERETCRALENADLAVTSIGTCSLEASLAGIPSLAVYKVPSTTYFIDKLLNRKPYMTITNNILRKTVIPEYIQSDLSHARLAEAIWDLLHNEQAQQAMLAEFTCLPRELGGKGSIGRAADLILEMAGCAK
ncbi:MAG: hypothetical protein GX335_00100 [Firmicutes bacterium]|nr:hypothetical protein [Bacillota bacterium]